MNKIGGMTSRNLDKKLSNVDGPGQTSQNLLIHGHVMMNAVQ